MPIFGRFDNKAKEVLDYAQQAAIAMRHRYWGTEHLLLGLLPRPAATCPDYRRTSPCRCRTRARQLTTADQEQPKVLELTPG